MITYELALALKNAGFEQSLDSFQGYYMDDSDDIGTHQVYIPTLSELIEACGDVFYTLIRVDRDYGETIFWVAKTYGARGHQEGETPEIAVANLYLQINYKK